MKRPHLILALVALTLAAVAQGPKSQAQTIQGWGTAVNPIGDCKFSTDGGQLVIEIPKSEKSQYDLAPDLSGSSAPRILTPVKGDFVIQVKVDTSSAAASEKSDAQNTGYYSGAGLVVFADEKNFIRFERAALFSANGNDPQLYTNFEIRVDGKVERKGSNGHLLPDKTKPVWLRLERKGTTMHASMSQDGENWVSLVPKELRNDAWTRDKIMAGIAAISSAKKTPFSPAYSDFSIRPGGQ